MKISLSVGASLIRGSTQLFTLLFNRLALQSSFSRELWLVATTIPTL